MNMKDEPQIAASAAKHDEVPPAHVLQTRDRRRASPLH